MNELRFGTAGLPFAHPAPKYPDGVAHLRKLGPTGSDGLAHMEMEFVHGVVRKKKEESVKDESYQEKLRSYMERHAVTGKIARKHDITLSAHGPYYINLNAQEFQKVEDSKRRIIETAMVGQAAGAFSITFHPAFYMGISPDTVYTIVRKRLESIVEMIRQEGVTLTISPETTGKGSQFGSLDELILLAEETEGVGLCIDFAHLHARSGGKQNTYDEFRTILGKVEDHLGTSMIKNMHIHLAGIAYSEKGERNHLILKRSDMNYPDLLRAFHDYDIAGAVVCESPNLQGDALLLKNLYQSMVQ